MSSNNSRGNLSNRSNQYSWSNLCTPAKLYGIVSLVSVAGMAANSQFLPMIGQAIFSVIWVFLLSWICNQGWTGLSWFLVLLPIIIVIMIIMAGVAVAVAEVEVPHMRQQQQQNINAQRQ